MFYKLAIWGLASLGGSVLALNTYHSGVEKDETTKENSNFITSPISIKPIEIKEIAINDVTCTDPIYRVTILHNESVTYYICNDIVDSTTTSTQITEKVITQTNNTFTQIKHFVSNSVSSDDFSTKWSYKNTQKHSETEFYWLNTTSSHPTFFIKKSEITQTATLDLTKESDIIALVEDLEHLRARPIIMINTSRVMNGLSCTKPKFFADNDSEPIEYYPCDVTKQSGNNSDELSTVKQKPLTAHTTFVTESGKKHIITNLSNKNSSSNSQWYKTSKKSTLEPFFIQLDKESITDMQTLNITPEIVTSESNSPQSK